MASFTNSIRLLEQWGISDVLLPFFLIFTITFAVLQRAKIFGDQPQTKGYNIVIATILGLVVIIPHILGRYPPGADIVNIINAALPNVAVVLVALVMVLLLIGIFGGSPKWVETGGGVVALLAFLLVAYIFGSAAGWFPVDWRISNFIDPDTQALLIVVAVFGLIVWFITREPKDSNPTDKGAVGKAFEGLGKMFGGP